MSETPLINIICYQLPYDLSTKIYREYESRLKEVNYMLDNYNYYYILKSERKTVEILLAITIFYKRIVANLDSAVKFHGKVSKLSKADTISIGAYKFTSLEKRKIQSLLIQFKKIIDRYTIPNYVFNYYETKEFLRHLKDLKLFDIERGEND